MRKVSRKVCRKYNPRDGVEGVCFVSLKLKATEGISI